MKSSKTVTMALVAFLVGTLPESGLSHMDTDLRYRFGKIIGLPEEYQPATFDRREFVLVLGDQRYEFPQFLIDLIRAQRGYRISMHGSWYQGHHYIAIDFHRRKNDGISCLFGLNDLSKISVTIDTPLENGGYRSEHVEMTEEQRSALHHGLKPSPQTQTGANKSEIPSPITPRVD